MKINYNIIIQNRIKEVTNINNFRQRSLDIFNQVDGVSKLYEEWAKAHGLRYNTFLLYYYLLDVDQLTQSQFSDQVNLPRQTVNSMVKKLEEEGMIELSVPAGSKKEKIMVLTERGHAYAKSVVEPVYTIEQQAGAVFSTQEYELFSGLLAKFSESMAQQIKDYLEENHESN